MQRVEPRAAGAFDVARLFVHEPDLLGSEVECLAAEHVGAWIGFEDMSVGPQSLNQAPSRYRASHGVAPVEQFELVGEDAHTPARGFHAPDRLYRLRPDVTVGVRATRAVDQRKHLSILAKQLADLGPAASQ